MHLAPRFAEHAALPEGHPHRERLRTELIDGYLPVARNVARRYGSRGEPTQDVEQVASMGLVLAVDRFDPGREIDFLSFAIPTINGEVLRYFRDRVHTMRTPRRLRELQSRIHDAAAELSQRDGRAPRPSEIARQLKLDIETILEALAAHDVAHTASLDELGWRDEGGASRDGGRFAAALGQTEPEFDLVEHREGLAPLLAALPERERKILLLRFFGGLTQTESRRPGRALPDAHLAPAHPHPDPLAPPTGHGLTHRRAEPRAAGSADVVPRHQRCTACSAVMHCRACRVGGAVQRGPLLPPLRHRAAVVVMLDPDSRVTRWQAAAG